MDVDNTISGEVWVNELRLVGVDDTPGWAYRVTTSLKLSDLGRMDFSYSKTDPFFHSLENRFGSREENTDLSAGASIGIEKLLPQSWNGTSLPVSYTYSQRNRQPRYFHNTDILVASAVEQFKDRGLNGDSVLEASQTYSESHVFAMQTIRFVLPSTSWYVDQTINRLSFGINYNKKYERNTLSQRKDEWGWGGRMGYDLNLPESFVQPFKSLFSGIPFLRDFKEYKLFYVPGKIQWNLTANRDMVSDIPRAKSNPTLTSNFRASRSFGL